MAEGLVVHSVPAFIERGFGELHDVDRIGDLDGVVRHRVERRTIRSRQIQRRPRDPSQPLDTALSEPAAEFAAVPARHDIEKFAAATNESLSLRALNPGPNLPQEQRFVEAERRDRVEPAGVVDQRGAVERDGVYRRVPVTAQIVSNLGHGASVTADLYRRTACRSGRERTACRRDLRVPVGPRPPARRALPALLAPHEAGRAAEHTGRSTSATLRVPWCQALRLQNDGRFRSMVTSTRNHFGHSLTPTTVPSGRPTNRARMRVGAVSKAQGLRVTQ